MPRVKFAVVREDPELECELVRLTRARAALTVASGGCTALTLAARFPELEVAAFDVNPAQLERVRAKRDAALRGDLAALNVENAAPALNQTGDFEALFRQLRGFLCELVAPPESFAAFFSGEADPRAEWTSSRYWPVAFELFFHERLLDTMFGPDATRHAARGSYPGYFQRAFERGLGRPDARRNPFLQHVLLGSYRRDDAPAYVHLRHEPRLELKEGSLEHVAALDRFSVVSLSNVFDWSPDELVGRWAKLLEATRPGTAVLVRQLNNERSVARFFEPAFRLDRELSARFLERDRSLFYERILVFVRSGR